MPRTTNVPGSIVTTHLLQRRWLGQTVVSLIYVGLAIISFAGVLRPLDSWIGDLRFGAALREPTGSVIFLDIDAASLATVGVWPWPRSLHARILDRLMEFGATEVVFDVDFSAASSPEQDQIFADALERSGGYAYLAAFQQSMSEAGNSQFNLPLPLFLERAQPVGVNVVVDAQGVARRYPSALTLGSEVVPSLASVLAGRHPSSPAYFGIDFSIEAAKIDRISAAALLEGWVDPVRVSGKQVVIGASAVELRDLFAVPGQGVIPGALLQIVATETLKQSRALRPLGSWMGIPFCLGIAVLALFSARGTRMVVIAGLATVLAGVAETAAVLAQIHLSIAVDTAIIHVALAAWVLTRLVTEVIARGVEAQAAFDRLRYLGTHDPLTGALNRTSFVERAREIASEDFAVVLVDLRRFRVINDALGHDQGDFLLQQVASRLTSMSQEVARLGGDSFAILVPHADAGQLQGLCEAVLQSASLPYELHSGHQAIIAASAGATTAYRSGRDVEVMLRHADMALSIAKQTTGNAAVLFERTMSELLEKSREMDTALRSAIAKHRFTLAYQPQVDIATGNIVGAEALARWADPELGNVSPARFIPAAEETGLIVDIGRWALHTACSEAAKWPTCMTIAVNVSAVQFELSDVVADIQAALDTSGLAAHRLEIEITESAFLHDMEDMKRVLGQVRALGVRIALDDFGTGYSSLSYLGALPIDKIKVDQSFVRRLPGDPEAVAVAQAVIAISKALNKSLIAEGIEDEKQALMLNAMGCRLAQGYLYGRPVAAEKFAEAWLGDMELFARSG